MKKLILIILIAFICIFNMPDNVIAADESVSLTETVTATQTDTAVVVQQFTYGDLMIFIAIILLVGIEVAKLVFTFMRW